MPPRQSAFVFPVAYGRGRSPSSFFPISGVLPANQQCGTAGSIVPVTQKGNMNKLTTIARSAKEALGLGLLRAVLAAFVVGMLSVSAQATLSTNITNIVTDLTSFFGDIQTLIIAVVVFGLAIGYAKMLRRK